MSRVSIGRDSRAGGRADHGAGGVAATEAAKAISKERAAAAECVNARACNRGLTRFLVRRIKKVTAVATRHALAHDMARTWWRLAAA